MFGSRPIALVTWLACSCLAAVGPGEHSRAMLLRELEQLGADLEARPAQIGPETWHRRARILSKRLTGLAPVPGSRVQASDVPPIAEMIEQLRVWAAPEARLPSAAQYHAWLTRLRKELDGIRRLGAAPPEEDVRRLARAELSSILEQRAYREFAEARPGLRARIADLVARYILAPMVGTKRAAAARRAVVIVCLALLGLLVGHITWELWTMLRRGQAVATGERAGTPGGCVRPLSSAEELLARGDRMRQAGRVTQAIGLYYLALISWLAGARCTRLDRTMTNWEHYRLARESGRLNEEDVRRLAELNAFFDDHYYGGRSPSSASVERFRSRILQLKNAI